MTDTNPTTAPGTNVPAQPITPIGPAVTMNMTPVPQYRPRNTAHEPSKTEHLPNIPQANHTQTFNFNIDVHSD